MSLPPYLGPIVLTGIGACAWLVLRGAQRLLALLDRARSDASRMSADAEALAKRHVEEARRREAARRTRGFPRDPFCRPERILRFDDSRDDFRRAREDLDGEPRH